MDDMPNEEGYVKSISKLHLKFYCEVCEQPCSSESKFKKHKKSLNCQRNHMARNGIEDYVKPLGEYQCKNCPKSFTEEYRLKFHVDNNNCNKQRVSYRCDPCGKVIYNKGDFERHLKTIKCQRQRKALGEIIKVKKTYKCPTCPKRYAQNAKLKKHLKDNKCPKTRNPDDETESEKEMEDDKDSKHKKVQCGYCNRFVHRKHLKEHLKSILCQQVRIAAGEKLTLYKGYTCNTCTKSFTKRGSLKEHEQNCSKVFKQVNKDDKNEKYYCDKCDYSCSWKSNFIEHKKTPTCVQNHQITDKKTRQEQPPIKLKFPCRYCDLILSSQSNMVAHMKTLHGKKITNGNLAAVREPKNQVRSDISRPFCCYICLQQYHRTKIAFECIYLCETRVNILTNGFVTPLFR